MIHSTASDNTFFTQPLVGVYADGKLETFLEHDVITTSGLETYSKYMQIKERKLTYSIHDTFAINRHGEVRKVRCFFWYPHNLMIPRGLVVLLDDDKAMKSAEEKCKNRVDSL